MKNLITILTVLLLVSCNKETDEVTIVGTWDVYQQKIIQNNGSEQYIDHNYTLTFNEDGTWTQNNTTPNNTSWSLTGNTLTKNSTICIVTWTIPNKEWNYSWDDGNMTLYLKN